MFNFAPLFTANDGVTTQVRELVILSTDSAETNVIVSLEAAVL